MPFTAKRHYTFSQLAERWNFSLIDLHYLAANGALEVQAWIEIPPVEFPQHAPPDSGSTDIPSLVTLTGYASLRPDYVRKVLRGEPGQLQIYPDDLVVSREARDGFEQAHNIEASIDSSSKSSAVTIELPDRFPGRSSTMWRIKKHFRERCEKDTVYETLQREGDYLAAWAAQTIDGQTPKSKSIRNTLRSEYSKYKSSRASQAQ